MSKICRQVVEYLVAAKANMEPCRSCGVFGVTCWCFPWVHAIQDMFRCCKDEADDVHLSVAFKRRSYLFSMTRLVHDDPLTIEAYC